MCGSFSRAAVPKWVSGSAVSHHLRTRCNYRLSGLTEPCKWLWCTFGFGNHCSRVGCVYIPSCCCCFVCFWVLVCFGLVWVFFGRGVARECSPHAGFFSPSLFKSLFSSSPVFVVLLLSLPTSEVLLGFPFSLPGISVGPHGSLLLLGVLGSNSICGCNQRHCAGEVAVFLKALSPLAQETDPKWRTLLGEACSIPGFQSSGTLFKKQSISNLRWCGDRSQRWCSFTLSLILT